MSADVEATSAPSCCSAPATTTTASNTGLLVSADIATVLTWDDARPAHLGRPCCDTAAAAAAAAAAGPRATAGRTVAAGRTC